MSHYTIRHADTHEPLSIGGPYDRGKAVSILLMRSHARVNGKDRVFVRSEWYVTEWDDADEEILSQMSADEFVGEYR